MTGYKIMVPEYSGDEKSRALEELALHLLRAKDGRVRGLRANGTIRKLAEELEKAENSIGGMPDSDDELSGLKFFSLPVVCVY
jgi:hypothetical protein